MRTRLALVLPLVAACGSSSDGGGGEGPAPCSLVTEAEMEALMRGPLDPPKRDGNDTCRFTSPDSVDARMWAIASVTLHSYESEKNAAASYDLTTRQTAGAAAPGAGERSYCSAATDAPGGAKSVIAYALVKRFVLQTSVIAPGATCEQGIAIAAAAAGRL